jgi:hypothetical protein
VRDAAQFSPLRFVRHVSPRSSPLRHMTASLCLSGEVERYGMHRKCRLIG